MGTNGDYAASVIKGENPSLNVAVFVNGAWVYGDLRCDRVRVWVDGNRIVVKVPTAGYNFCIWTKIAMRNMNVF